MEMHRWVRESENREVLTVRESRSAEGFRILRKPDGILQKAYYALAGAGLPYVVQTVLIIRIMLLEAILSRPALSTGKTR